MLYNTQLDSHVITHLPFQHKTCSLSFGEVEWMMLYPEVYQAQGTGWMGGARGGEDRCHIETRGLKV